MRIQDPQKVFQKLQKYSPLVELCYDEHYSQWITTLEKILNEYDLTLKVVVKAELEAYMND